MFGTNFRSRVTLHLDFRIAIATRPDRHRDADYASQGCEYRTGVARQFENQHGRRHLANMSEGFDPADYSVVVKLRGNPPKPWKWEIYRAGRWGP